MTAYIHRSTPVEIAVKDDGRTVEAYAAVFDVPARVSDVEGRYMEVIDRTAFNKAIADARPQGGRQAWKVGVFYNHGMTLHGESSDAFSVPIARTEHLEADSTGVLTVARYADTTLANDVLALIREGVITAQSFTGKIVRSSPQLRTGGRYRPGNGGQLPTVRRLELGLQEYGPTPVPVYADAAVVGVRSQLLGTDLRALRALLGVTPDEDVIEEDDVPDTDPAVADAARSDTVPDGPPSDGTPPVTAAGDEHVARHDDEWLREFRAALRTRGIV
jgi:HK97 family phage prohead protease